MNYEVNALPDHMRDELVERVGEGHLTTVEQYAELHIRPKNIRALVAIYFACKDWYRDLRCIEDVAACKAPSAREVKKRVAIKHEMMKAEQELKKLCIDPLI